MEFDSTKGYPGEGPVPSTGGNPTSAQDRLQQLRNRVRAKAARATDIPGQPITKVADDAATMASVDDAAGIPPPAQGPTRVAAAFDDPEDPFGDDGVDLAAEEEEWTRPPEQEDGQGLTHLPDIVDDTEELLDPVGGQSPKPTHQEAQPSMAIPLPDMGFSEQQWRKLQVLVVATANTTSAAGLRRLLGRWADKPWRPHITMVQEHHLVHQADCDGMVDYLKERGFFAIINPARRTSDGGSSGGVAVLAPAAWGMRRVTTREDEAAHRLLVVEVEVGPQTNQRIMVASTYWQPGQRVTQVDIDIVDRLRQVQAAHHEYQWVVGGDWNLETRQAGKVVSKGLGLDMITPPAPTCYQGAAASMIDAIATNKAMALRQLSSAVDIAAPTRPHRPAMVAFTPQWSQTKVPGWEPRRRLPRQPVVGPRRQPRTWEEPLAAAEKALARAQSTNHRREARDALDRAISAWLPPALAEMAEASDTVLDDQEIAKMARSPPQDFHET